MGIGDRIKECRKACGMTLEEVSAHVKLSRQTLSRYETGIIKNIPSDVIERLAKALHTTPGYLMGWEDVPSETLLFDVNRDGKMKSSPLNKDELSPIKREIIETLSDYTDDDLRMFLDILYAVRRKKDS